MQPYWVEFKNHKPGTVDANDEAEAKEIASAITKDEVISASILPYGAHPRLDKANRGGDFCFDPEQCKGRSSCPRRYACSE